MVAEDDLASEGENKSVTNCFDVTALYMVTYGSPIYLILSFVWLIAISQLKILVDRIQEDEIEMRNEIKTNEIIDHYLA